MTRWFRWYESTTEDGKFRMVARNANVTVATVIGVWAALLEDASHPDHRGVCVKGEDYYAAILDLEPGEVQTILASMQDSNLISVGHGAITINKWKDRQFETDTSDPTNADRQRRFRQRKALNGNVTPRNVPVTETKRPDTEAETDTEVESPLPPPGAVRVEKALPKFGKLEALECFNAYNAAALELGLPQAAKLTPNRERSIVARLKDYGVDGWHKAISNLHGSRFLTGKTDQGFRADLDFVCQAKSFGKLHDGGYGSAPPKASKPASTFAHPRRDDDESWKDQIAAEWLRENGGALQ